MKLFTSIYDYIIGLAYREKVTRYLYGLSFIESIFFPIPPDVLLAPIALTKKYNWIKIAFYTTLYSVLGGLIGYIIGFYLYETSIFNSIIKESIFFEVKDLFDKHGVIIMIIAGFSPLPFKAFTITAGYMSLPIFLFVFSSFIGRSLRFFLVAALFHYLGESIANKIKKYFEYIGWTIVIISFYIIFLKYF